MFCINLLFSTHKQDKSRKQISNTDSKFKTTREFSKEYLRNSQSTKTEDFMIFPALNQKARPKLSKAGWLDKKAGVGELFPEKCRKNMENGQYRRICQLPHPVKAPISSSRRLAVKGYKIITPKTSPTKNIKGATKSTKT